jgi:U3 small nucleolar RNA-associated protein 21
VKRHASGVYGVAVDALNSTVVSADAEGLVIFWDFNTHVPVHDMTLPSGASGLVLHRDAGLAAVSCDDAAVRVLDVAARRQVRQFHGHSNRITDMAFSPDARWLVTSSLDRTIRAWDMPSGRCVDWLAFAAAPLSVAFSPTSEYLVTAHVDSPGLFLWANRAHFSTVYAEAIPSAPVQMDLPLTATATSLGDGSNEAPMAPYGVAMAAAAAEAGDAASSSVLSALGEDAAATAVEGRRASKRPRVEGGAGALADADDALAAASTAATSRSGGPAPVAKPGCSITLAGAPLSSWQHLGKLDLIMARNKPRQAPKKPEAAPFFLPTVQGLNPSFLSPAAAGGSAGDGSRILQRPSGGLGSGRVLVSLLRACPRDGAGPTGPFTAVAAHLASLSPSLVDAEVRSLSLGTAEDEEGVALLHALLAYFAYQLASGTRFELTQAHMQLALHQHQDVIARVPALRRQVRRVGKLQAAAAAQLCGMLDSGLCMASTFLGQ